ncbi:hypothetical protein HUJ04_005534 [Dendroctonus ponderosae]
MDIRNVLVADAVDEACVALLQRHSIQVDCKYKLSKEQLIQAIQNYDAIVVRSDTKVGAEVIQAGSRLKAIGRAGAGVDNIDVNAATARDVVVLNTPGGNAISACELTCALIANLARNVAAASASLKAGRWDRKLYAGRELSGKTLAIIGLGRIGKEEPPTNPVTLELIAHDKVVATPHLGASTAEAQVRVAVEVAEQLIALTGRSPEYKSTSGVINRAVLEKLTTA